MAEQTQISLCLSPNGNFHVNIPNKLSDPVPEYIKRFQQDLSLGNGHALLALGGKDHGVGLPPVWSYWRDIGAKYLTMLCNLPDINAPARIPDVMPSTEAFFEELAAAAPLMTGAEYITGDFLRNLWGQIDSAFRQECTDSGLAVPEFLKTLNPAWNLVGRVHFNLAENRKDESCPFAFMATYTPKISSHGKIQHQPLGNALKEFAGSKKHAQLLSLLLPVQKASSLVWLKEMSDSGEIYHPVRWSVHEAVQFLQDIPTMEQSGIIVRMPASWRAGRPSRPKVKATLGQTKPSGLGADALLSFQMEIALDGEALTQKEIKGLLDGSDGLAFIRGKWVEIDKERLARIMDRFQAIEKLASSQGVPFSEAMRLLSGFQSFDEAEGGPTGHWSEVLAGDWLAETLCELRNPETLTGLDPGREIIGTLRPYQDTGARWLHLLGSLGLGACLADDMGLGKTLQVLSLLNMTKNLPGRTSLLVAPASLISNWAAEICKFAPGLTYLIAHPSEMGSAKLKDLNEEVIAQYNLVITTYGTVLRMDWTGNIPWHYVILDEAQAIKNPDAKQTRAVKKLKAAARIALTGTPIENRIGDLWSIFDFLNPGLLGSAKDFSIYTKQLENIPHNPYGSLRELVRPYLLRRLKTDKNIVSDLPDKTEVKAYCTLSKKQAALYQQSVRELEKQLEIADGIKRKGIVLAFLMRFKQICNHPSQWLGDGTWNFADSGKLQRLSEIAEVVSDKQEKMLVFTQFREMTSPLDAFLGSVFGRPGLVLHGGTAVKDRKDIVRQFQENEQIPYFVLSLKAGGSGLNLTAAQHVIHFDRWWNPSVENQATDRAFRIGQTKNVLVHKFICKGTVEDKIDSLIESKNKLTRELLEGGGEIQLTEMSNAEILKLVALDLHSITGD